MIAEITKKKTLRKEDLKKLEGFILQSVMELDENFIILHLKNNEKKKIEITVFIPPRIEISEPMIVCKEIE